MLLDAYLRTRVCLIYYGPRGAHVVRTRWDSGCVHCQTQNSELRVPLGNVEHSGWVAGDLRATLDVDPNPNGILPLQWRLRQRPSVQLY